MSGEKLLRFGLVGASNIARKHAAALNRISCADLVAVADLDRERAQTLSSQFDIPSNYSSYRQMLESEQLDAVCVLTPSGQHAQITFDVANAGCHVIVEKPMALTVADAESQLRECDKNDVKLFVVKQNRFSRPVVALKEAIENDYFGKIVLGSVRVRWCREQAYYDSANWRGTWAQDGGVLSNQASHHIDLISWLLGDVTSVMAMNASRIAEIEAEDTSGALLRFASGAIGIIEATTAWRPTDLEGSICISGERGNVELGGFVVNELTRWDFGSGPGATNPPSEAMHSNPSEFAYTHEQFLKSVCESIISGTSIDAVTGKEGIKAVRLINALYASSVCGREVSLDEELVESPLGRVAPNNEPYAY